MPVSDKNDKYTLFLPDWEMVRDCIEGERKVKSRSSAYLPIPPGLKNGSGDFKDLTAREKYEFLLSFAELPEYVAPSSRMITGIITHKDPIVQIPKQMEFLHESCTPDGLTLMDFFREIVQNIIRYGRYGVLCDAPSGGGNPYFVGYECFDVWNWYQENIKQKKVLTFISNDESYTEFDYSEDYSSDTVSRLRVCVLRDGVYIQEVHQGDAEESFDLIEQFEPVNFRGQPFNEIPYVMFGSTDLDICPDQIPLAGVSRNCVAAYKKYAIYNRSLYMTGDPTVLLKGIDPQDPNAPSTIGSGSIWFLGREDDAKFLEYEGKSIEAQRTAIQDNLDQANQAGARLLMDAGMGESGEAIKMRIGSQMATAKTISMQAASGLEKLLKYCAQFIGADEKEIIVQPNLDFVTNRMAADELLKFVQARNQGAPISNQSIHTLAKQGELTTMDYEEEQALITSEEMESIPQSRENFLGIE